MAYDLRERAPTDRYCPTVATRDDWAARLARTIGRRVRAFRTARRPKTTAEELAERVSPLGASIKPAVLTNLETGRRGNVTVAELLALARALGVPPVLLLFPIGEDQTIEILDGIEVPTWDAFRWFVGEARFPSPLVGGGERDPETGLHELYDDPEEGWQEGATPINIYRRYQRAVDDYYAMQQEFPQQEDKFSVQTAELFSQRRSLVWNRLRLARYEMRIHNLVLPPAPEGLAFRDDNPDRMIDASDPPEDRP